MQLDPNTPGGLSQLADERLPEHIKAHLPGAELAAHANLARVREVHQAALDTVHKQLSQVLSPAVSRANRLIRIRHLAGENSKIYEKQAACSAGCNHCCHVNVLVPRAEAKLIAKAIGRQVSEPSQLYSIGEPGDRVSHMGEPCTFLVAGRCSIYAHRPLVCRTLVNMDSVPLLCELVPDMQVPVPYLNTTEFQGLFAYVTQQEDFADVRDWFPGEAAQKISPAP